MAVIPKYVSNRNATTEPASGYMKPQRIAEGISPELAARTSPGAMMEDIGSIANSVANKILKISNANAESQANIDSTISFAAIEDRVNKDPNLDHALDNVDSDIEQVRAAASKQFIDPRARQEYLRQFNLKATIFKLGLNTNLQKRQVDRGRVNTLKELDLESSNYINAPTPEVKLASRQQMDYIMQKAIDLQLFSREQGYDEVSKVVKAADLATEDLKDLRKRKEREIELAANEAKNAREQELIQLRVNKNSSLEDLIKQVNKDMNAGRIDPKFAEAFINSCKTPAVVGTKTKSAKFVGFVNDMLYNKVKPKDVDIALMEANTAGSLSDEDFNTLVTFNQEVNSGIKLEQMLPNVSAMRGIQYWGDENAGARSDSKQRMFKSYMLKVKQGLSPEVASEETIREEVLTLFPQARTASKDGLDIMDMNGVIKHIMPNGDLTVVGKKAEKK